MNAVFQHEQQFIKVMHDLFKKHGYEIRLVGGAVRDILQGIFPKDLDFCTNATPEQMMAMNNDGMSVIPTGIEHGTITFMSLWGTFEVTTLRKDVECDGRHATVEFTNDWKVDAERRDFTFNAMSMDVDGTIYDYFNGQEDLKNGIVRFIGEAIDRINEDALRIIRYFRFISHFNNFDTMNKIIPKDFWYVSSTTHLLKNVSVERIWMEFKKLCKNDPNKVSFFISLLHLSGACEKLNFPCENLDKLRYIKDYVAKYPTFAIAALCNDMEEAFEFSIKYKLSVVESNELFRFACTKFTYKTFDDFGFDNAEDMINGGIDREWIKALASYMNNGFLEEGIDGIEKTEFPISGQDVLDYYGIKEGKEVGSILKNLKIIWKQTRYKLTKQELFDIVAK